MINFVIIQSFTQSTMYIQRRLAVAYSTVHCNLYHAWNSTLALVKVLWNWPPAARERERASYVNDNSRYVKNARVISTSLDTGPNNSSRARTWKRKDQLPTDKHWLAAFFFSFQQWGASAARLPQRAYWERRQSAVLILSHATSC